MAVRSSKPKHSGSRQSANLQLPRAVHAISGLLSFSVGTLMESVLTLPAATLVHSVFHAAIAIALSSNRKTYIPTPSYADTDIRSPSEPSRNCTCWRHLLMQGALKASQAFLMASHQHVWRPARQSLLDFRLSLVYELSELGSTPLLASSQLARCSHRPKWRNCSHFESVEPQAGGNRKTLDKTIAGGQVPIAQMSCLTIWPLVNKMSSFLMWLYTFFSELTSLFLLLL